MIYLLEDEENIRRFVLYALRASGWEAEGFETPAAFWKALEQTPPELLLLDWMLPGEDGLTVLQKLRARADTRRLPVILLTAKSTELDKVTALDAGADDYVTKPFGTLELISRVRALLRRSGEAGGDGEYRLGGLYVDTARRLVRVDGADVPLTRKEFELLALLLSGRGRVFTRDRLLETIWGYDYNGENRTVDVHIRTLRVKLGACGALVETVRGTGYKIGGPV